MIKLYNNDCLKQLKELADNSVDSIITDPPYELGFMGKSWDSTGIANNKEMWAECLRVLKHGGHLLAFGGTRTYHRMACAIEDAGFEVRDMIEWVYGSGFPKSLNIGKAIDKLQGNKREVSGYEERFGREGRKANCGFKEEYVGASGTQDQSAMKPIMLPVSNEAKQWEGWGTATKPAHEPICMARKPLAEKTVAENVLKWGTGGINIDASRVEIEENTSRTNGKTAIRADKGMNSEQGGGHSQGRFPANLITDGSEEVRECFPETKSGGGNKATKTAETFFGFGGTNNSIWKCDSGNTSRFFKSIIYQAKASKSDRNEGCKGIEEKEGIRTNAPRENEDIKTPTRTNNHPTVKPTALMQYLIKMITPKGGTVLDPFMGSGSTGKACIKDGFSFIGIEKEEEYFKIAEARILIKDKQLEF
jgi:site-specific DNA-methyltransferase (adenine-specific)